MMFKAHIAEVLREKILDQLDNSEITNKEVDLLINEIGNIVVELQRIFIGKVHDMEQRIMIQVEEMMEQKSSNTTVNINVQKDNAGNLDDLLNQLLKGH